MFIFSAPCTLLLKTTVIFLMKNREHLKFGYFFFTSINKHMNYSLGVCRFLLFTSMKRTFDPVGFSVREQKSLILLPNVKKSQKNNNKRPRTEEQFMIGSCITCAFSIPVVSSSGCQLTLLKITAFS